MLSITKILKIDIEFISFKLVISFCQLRVYSHLFMAEAVIAYLIDPDSYAGWSFYTPGWASQIRQVEGYRGQTK